MWHFDHVIHPCGFPSQKVHRDFTLLMADKLDDSIKICMSSVQINVVLNGYKENMDKWLQCMAAMWHNVKELKDKIHARHWCLQLPYKNERNYYIIVYIFVVFLKSIGLLTKLM